MLVCELLIQPSDLFGGPIAFLLFVSGVDKTSLAVGTAVYIKSKGSSMYDTVDSQILGQRNYKATDSLNYARHRISHSTGARACCSQT